MLDTCPLTKDRHKILMDIDKEGKIENKTIKNVTVADMLEIFDKIYKHYDEIKDARKRAIGIVD